MTRYLVLLALALPLSAQVQSPCHKADAPLVIVNALNFGAAAFDVETTQRCIRAGTCHEANPLMPSNRAGQYAQAFAIGAVVGGVSWKLKKDHSRAWWIPPVINASAHLAAGFLNLRFSGRQP